MDVHVAVKTRREITSFQSTPIQREHLKQLIEVGHLSVTGNNLPSREFIIVEERETLQQLTKATPFVPWLAQTPAAIVIVGNPQESKYWLQDATIATSNLWLAATELQIGAAWGAIHHSEDPEECARREQIVKEALGIPIPFRPVSILGLGYPKEIPGPKDMVPFSRVVHRSRFGNRVENLDEI